MAGILRVFAIVALVTFKGLVGSKLQACSCLPPQPPLLAAEEVDLVFAGEVQTVEATEPGVPFSPLRVTVRADETFVGDATATEFSVLTGSDSALCGYSFQPGESYLIYARESQEGYWTGICDRTRRLSAAEEDLEALRNLPTPVSLQVAVVAQGLELTVVGGEGRGWQLEESADLESWEPVVEGTSADSPLSVIRELAVGAAHRFFRVRQREPQQGFYGLTLMLPGACLEDPERPGECLNLPFPGVASYDVRAFSDRPDLGRDNPIVTSFQSQNEPNPIRVSGVHAAALDEHQLTDALRLAFNAEGLELSAAALVNVQRPERSWIVHDPENQLVLFGEREGEVLSFVRTGSFRVPLPVGEYCVWSFFGCERQVTVTEGDWQFQLLQVALP